MEKIRNQICTSCRNCNRCMFSMVTSRTKPLAKHAWLCPIESHFEPFQTNNEGAFV